MREHDLDRVTKRQGWGTSALLAFALATSAGCTGFIEDGPSGPGWSPDRRTPDDPGDPGDPPGVTCDPDVIHASPASTARLTPAQYMATLRDLVGAPSLALAVTDTAVATLPSTEQLVDAAASVVDQRSAWSREVIPCDTSGAADRACVTAFLDGFAARAYRRPLRPEERTALEASFDRAIGALSFADSMDVLVQIVLASPQVVLRQELGVEDPALPPGIRRLTDHELATRLSYSLWGTTPDDALLTRAAEGTLHHDDVLRDEIARMLTGERGQQAIHEFVAHWLELDGGTVPSLDVAEKDPTLYPSDSPALRRQMRRELYAFVDWAMEHDGGRISTLLSSRRAYVNGPLAALYGVPHAGADSEWEWIDLPEGERAGMLTRAAFLTVFSPANVDSPIRRGAFVRREVLCRPLPPPPADVDDTTPTGGLTPDGELLSVREDVTARTSAEDRCVACHQRINPLGFTFGHYDAIGAFRANDIPSGRPIDASGTSIGTASSDDRLEDAMPVADAVDLSHLFASDDQPTLCLTDRWIAQTLGTAPLDPCVLADIRSRALETGAIRDIVVAIVTTDAFRYIDVRSAEEVSR